MKQTTLLALLITVSVCGALVTAPLAINQMDVKLTRIQRNTTEYIDLDFYAKNSTDQSIGYVCCTKQKKSTTATIKLFGLRSPRSYNQGFGKQAIMYSFITLALVFPELKTITWYAHTLDATHMPEQALQQFYCNIGAQKTSLQGDFTFNLKKLNGTPFAPKKFSLKTVTINPQESWIELIPKLISKL